MHHDSDAKLRLRSHVGNPASHLFLHLLLNRHFRMGGVPSTAHALLFGVHSRRRSLSQTQNIADVHGAGRSGKNADEQIHTFLRLHEHLSRRNGGKGKDDDDDVNNDGNDNNDDGDDDDDDDGNYDDDDNNSRASKDAHNFEKSEESVESRVQV